MAHKVEANSDLMSKIEDVGLIQRKHSPIAFQIIDQQEPHPAWVELYTSNVKQQVHQKPFWFHNFICISISVLIYCHILRRNSSTLLLLD